MKILLEIVSTPTRPCVCIGDKQSGLSTRVAGPKPWGGGSVIYRYEVDSDELREAIDEAEKLAEKELTSG